MRFISGMFGRTRGLLLLAVAGALLMPWAAQAGFDFDAQGNVFVTGQAMIAFKPGTSQLTIKSILAKYGVDTSSMQFLDGQTVSVNFDERKDVQSFCQQVRSSTWVTAASPNHVFRCTTSDPCYGYQWGLMLPSARVGADFTTAWGAVNGYSSLRAGTKVAVIDTGLDLRNVDFGAYPSSATFLPFLPGIYQAMTFTNATPYTATQLNPPTSGFSPGVPWDDFGHGTHVAGIIAAKINDNTGIAGGAPASILYPMKVLDRSGAGTEQNVGLAIRFAATNGCRVINMSLGGGAGTNAFWITNSVMFALTQTVDKTVVPNTTFKGCVLVASMGNDGAQVANNPAVIPGVIAVAAANPDGTPANYTTLGPWVHVMAPGGDGGPGNGGLANNVGQIFSTYPRYNVSLGPPTVPPVTDNVPSSQSNHTYMSGTSMAAPHVSAAVSLLLQKKPNLSAAQVAAALAMYSIHLSPINAVTNSLGAATQIPDTARDNDDVVNLPHWGYGRLEVYNLVTATQPASGSTRNIPHVFPFNPRNHLVYTPGQTIPSPTTTFGYTLTGLDTIDTVRANATNSFRVTVVDDNGNPIPTAQVTAKFSILAYVPPSGGVYPSGYPGSNISDAVLYDDGAHNDLLAGDCVYGNNVFITGDYSNTVIQVQYVVTAPGTSLKANTNRVVNLLVH